MTAAPASPGNRAVVREPARREKLDRFFAALQQVCERAAAGHEFLMDLQLVVEEACVNVMNHGYSGREPGVLEMTVQQQETPDGAAIVIRLRDDGMAFNPLASATPDVSAAAEDREIGGLGIHLIRQMTDHQHYEREAGTHNCLTLIKHLPGAPGSLPDPH